VRHSRGRGERGVGHLIDRRTFLGASLALAAAPVAFARAAELESALGASAFVYVSPLLSDGSESTCHGEVWFGWIDGAVVLITGSDRWKARAVRRGLDRARLWVGDHGRWKGVIGKNEDFRQAPSFDARAAFSKDAALLERLLSVYDRKYPQEISEWRPRMQAGFRDGSRVLVRYVPLDRAPVRDSPLD
jgi:hypothetical protein